MIGITKLLTGTATVSAAVRARPGADVGLLQFSAEARPVVVWNITGDCNLKCRHCYAAAYADADRPELSTAQALAFIEDLAAMKVPVVIFSGGEPLMRRDIFERAAAAAAAGLRPVLSTNGTLITADVADRLKAASFAYVGVSLDGIAPTHDYFRNRAGAFDEAISGLRRGADAGLRTGVRFTLTHRNFPDLEAVLDLVEKEGIKRFCMYHLVYAGRGKDIIEQDAAPEESRRAVEILIAKALDWHERGVETEILTADNHADGVLVLKYVEAHNPARAGEVRTLLEMSGGCSAGRKIAAVDPAGNVCPCQFWTHESLGNILERPFSEIWHDEANPLLAKLRSAVTPQSPSSRLARCAYRDLCRGCRIRARAATGDTWADDPQCYLTTAETGN
ncbi:MAG: radical SAM protein [Planctomycetes bacterium]|nr:radical SAM protein [Planctomycetota bacterium]